MSTNAEFVRWIASNLSVDGGRDGLRTKRGLAKALSLDPSIVTRIVQGRRRIKADEVEDIARYLGTPIPWRRPTEREDAAEARA